MNTKIISSGLLALALFLPLMGAWAEGGNDTENLSAPVGTENNPGNNPEEYQLLDIEALDKAVGYTEVDEDGHQNRYLRRNLDSVVDRFAEHSDDVLHSDADYRYWREYLRRPHPTVDTIKHFFANAAQEFGVPVEILQAIGQVENNWTQIGPSIDQGWGIMHLVQNNYADTLTEAANLPGVSAQMLKDDARQNIRGGAALLAKYAGTQRDSFTQLEDWFEATKQLSGLIDDELREMQAKRYYNVMKTGVVSSTLWGETIRLEAHPEINLSSRAIRRNTRSTDYASAITKLTSCNFNSGRNRTIDTWVNHWIGTGTYAGAISTFQDCKRQASAHFVISSSGEITQVVSVGNTAWHAGANGYPYNNSRSIGVEHEVTATNPNGWNTTWTTPLLKASANMARYFADQYRIPKTRPPAKADKPGLRGHHEMPGTNTACPGTFPWDTWMSFLNLSIFDLWVKAAPIYAGVKGGFDAQFKLKNYTAQTMVVTKVAMAIHDVNGKFVSDMKIDSKISIGAGQFYQMPYTKVDSPSTAGQYKVVAKVSTKTDSQGRDIWEELASASFTVLPSLGVVDLWVKSGTPIYAGAKGGFDAQFKLKNLSNQSIVVPKVAMAIHDAKGVFLKDMKVSVSVSLKPGEFYQMPKTVVDSPTIAGRYKVVAKVSWKTDTQGKDIWEEMAAAWFTVTK
jgi:N-acetyl-anhydromuramyl-L-alanine amidase AmpD